jgi:hypothetical protein
MYLQLDFSLLYYTITEIIPMPPDKGGGVLLRDVWKKED